ncbi:flagellar FlbD family protein [Brevibacillus sp. SYP-B805]|uniref:flagellar FlbD family protein n=1 Tax=Brevibacillus sp. SYP-B805 TaxID=1578199 RepID=UPI0013EE1028|nr:flagellar FlbD family protein [Brevibacillus sp. SYP-B805]NGQ94014.1 flagellar FlbD family protein [Brevibacillus sp. SYP-B805]
MLELTRLNGTRFFLNITHIETVEATPDTVITLSNGKKYIVKDRAADVAERISAFYQKSGMPAIIPRPVDDFNE